MAFYYVKSDGTATGDGGRYATQQTGSFDGLGASGYYSSLIDVFENTTTAPTGGDYVLCSDLHSYDNVTSAMVYNGPMGTGKYAHVISVSDTDITTYSAGAKEETNNLIRPSGYMVFEGFTLDTTSGLSTFGSNGSLIVRNCTIYNFGSNPFIGAVFGDGWKVVLENTEINTTSANLSFRGRGGSRLDIINCSLTGTPITNLFEDNGVNAGCTINFLGCDLTNVTGYLLAGYGSRTDSDLVTMTVKNCKLGTLTGFVEESIVNYGGSLLVTNSSNNATEAEYQYFYADSMGQVESNATIYRDESTAFESGTKVSFKVDTTTYPNIGTGVIFELSRYADLSTNGTVRVYFASTDTLTDQDVWAELIYPDGTTANQYNYLSTRNVDPLATGTTHTSDTGSTWKNGAGDLAGHNEYYLDIDTSVDPGSNGVPLVRIHVDKPSTTVYFDTTIGLV